MTNDPAHETRTCCGTSARRIELNLSPELPAKLGHVAVENNSGAEEYIRQLVEHYLDHDAWFCQKVRTGLGQLDREEFTTHEEIGARINQMFRS